MRVAHFAQFGPRSCGLYETAKDLILAERRLGVDAVLVDIDEQEKSRPGLRDGQIVTEHPEIAYDCDVLIRHSAMPASYQNIGKPIVMCLHGRPESSYRIAASSSNDIIQAVANKARDARHKAFVTFWPEYEVAWRALVGDKLHLVPAPVDLDYYAGGTDRRLAGSTKILIADIWRDDVIPLNVVFGAARYIDRYDSGAQIHIVGLPGGTRARAAVTPFFNGLRQYIGSLSEHMADIRDYYASCDVVVTPHTIATRVIRESLAAGKPVVAGAGCRHTPYRCAPTDPDSVADAIHTAVSTPDACKAARRTAVEHFDAAASAEAMIRICSSVITRQSGPRKIFFDVGAHLGETVRRFYRQRPDADEFEIYCFEPDPATFSRLFDNIGSLPNVHCICGALASHEGIRHFHRGRANAGEGSTMMEGKLTGALGEEIEVNGLDAASWIDRLVGPDDYCIVKMNCEGAEYELLPYFVKTGTIRRISELYVQLHSLKFDTQRRIQMDQIEIQWAEDMIFQPTKVFATTKGMASFGNSGDKELNEAGFNL